MIANTKMYNFTFESYGVKVGVECPSEELLAKSEAKIRSSLLGRLTVIERDNVDFLFTIKYREKKLHLDLNGKYISESSDEYIFMNYFETMIRLTIAEHAVDRVFMHAGAVVVNGKALVFPADSFCGKTTLVAEFVKRGAIYYSDEYAVFDEEGLLHPFPRKLSIRYDQENFVRTDVSAESLGGVIGLGSISPSLVLLTKYCRYSRWSPEILSEGNAVMQMIPQAISLRYKSDFTVKVLKKIANRAIIVQSMRGGSKSSVDKINDFVDKFVL